MSILEKIQEKQPLILNLANFVTPQRVADAISFAGGSPLMTAEISESETLVEIADAVMVNIGTISEKDYPLFLTICQLANQKHKPLILDPVAVNVPFRANFVKRLMQEVKFDIIRGNSAEIAWFADKESLNKGIDALESNLEVEHARVAAQKTGAVIIQTGKVDVISNGFEELFVETDSPLFKINVGCGDMLSAIVGTFAAVSDDLFKAAHEATEFFGESGVQATEQVENLPGNFVNLFLIKFIKRRKRLYKGEKEMIDVSQVVTIAGIDSSGGAGINADLKTFHNQKVYSATIVTGLTAQNTYGVQEILPTNKAFILAQFDSVFSDLEISAAKTGALFDTAQVEAVIQGLKKYKPKHLLVDPVMVAKGGAILLTREAIDLIKKMNCYL